VNVVENAAVRTFDTPRPISLVVDQVSGRLEIETSSLGSTEVRITALHPDADGAADYASRARVELDGDTLQIQLPHANALRRKHPQVRTQVTLPHNSGVELRTAATTMTTDGPLGDVSVKSASGSITVDHARDVTVRTAAGDVEVGQATGRVSVRSASSRVSVGRANGLEVKGAASEVHAVRLTGDVTIQTATGNIRVDALGAGTAKIEGKLVNLEIGVVAGTDVHLDLSTGVGVVDCELEPLDAEPVGGGQLRLRASSATGRVRVYRSLI
jgi:hypothetical protein